jgi:hypothetical protein
MAEALRLCTIRRRYVIWCVHRLAAHDMKLIRIALFAALAGVALLSAAQPRDPVDQPSRRLQISLRIDEGIEQRVQVLEGRRAYIPSGQSRPAMQRQRIQAPDGVIAQDTFVVQETIAGFEVVPHISGDRVLLEIAPQRQSFDSQGSVQGQAMTTRASGRLGEWFEAGAIASGDSRSAQSKRIRVKVEEIGN